LLSFIKQKDSVSEFTIGLLLNTARRISESIEICKSKEWSSLWNITWLIGRGNFVFFKIRIFFFKLNYVIGLAGSTIGIYGLGRIGIYL
jgi:phosphoglycerate dehydrogenase-like enzyme